MSIRLLQGKVHNKDTKYLLVLYVPLFCQSRLPFIVSYIRISAMFSHLNSGILTCFLSRVRKRT